MLFIGMVEPTGLALLAAIRGGNVHELERLLGERPDLAQAWLVPPGGPPADPSQARSLLHVATDWPGHFPNGAHTVAALVRAGADVNARATGRHTETPLHWAASSDDVPVLDALLDAGADIEADGAVIAGGTPLSDAVAFGQWRAARRLVERGARPGLPEAAALGLLDHLEARWAADEPPHQAETTSAFWYACHGGARDAAEFLLARGAELNWVSEWDGLTPLDAARRSEYPEVVAWLRGRGAKCASELPAPS